MASRKKIAAIVTVYFPASHADVIVTKFLKGFPTDEGLLSPRVDIASLYVDQTPADDVSRRFAAEHDVPIFDSIVGALTLGGKELAVDGVLLIGEHGEYAWNEKGQHLYPRKYFMEQICGVMATSKRAVPVFNDKHLSYNWHDAKWMVERAAALGAPFMAGSSLVTCWRDPWLEHPLGTRMQEALVVSYSGLDVYGFHALETLQCMVERREGAERGVAAVTCLEGEVVWAAAAEGRWPRDLADAALARIPDKPAGGMERHCPNPALFIVEYRDGFRGYVLMLTGYIEQFGYAVRLAGGEVASTLFYLATAQPHPHFSYLGLNIEEMFVTGKPSYPVERTLLTSGVLEAALDSRYQGQVRLETPHLAVEYQAPERVPWRPSAPRPSASALQPVASY
ncbi:MAG TPA: hypothetical protein VNK95_21450 [Caldilineaceae bacterium]|nr:hypothetical protein [Caldilineaceae bacterium]